jgi:hypothetical protein
MSAIEKLKRGHPPWHSGDAYLRKGKIGRVHAYSASGGGVSSCGGPLRENKKDEIQRMY